MTLTALNVLSFGAVGEAFGDWCQNFTVKDLMGRFGVAEQTAKKWRTGKIAEPKHLVAMVEEWGADFLNAVFAPALAHAEADLESELELIETRLGHLRERIRDENSRNARLRGDAGGVGAGAGGRQRSAVVAGDPLHPDRRAAAAPRPPLRRRLAGALTGLLLMAGSTQPVLDDLSAVVADLLGAPIAANLSDDGAVIRPGRRAGRQRRLDGAGGLA
ncbi:MAG: hypothetical protein HQL42_13190 [Alphaproteobacteria bacterium]|nr:hypothetical protein [Alphaproteobacteria bacterium]